MTDNYRWLKNIAVENREIHCFEYQSDLNRIYLLTKLAF